MRACAVSTPSWSPMTRSRVRWRKRRSRRCSRPSPTSPATSRCCATTSAPTPCSWRCRKPASARSNRRPRASSRWRHSPTSVTAGASRRRHPPTRELARIMEFVVGGSDMSAYVPLLEEELALLGEDRRGPDLAQGRHRARHRVPCGHHRRRDVGPARRAPPPNRRRGVRRAREERRRRRDLVREQLSGLSRRQPEPQLQLLVRATPRLAVSLLLARRATRLLPALRERLRLARPHPVRHRGALGYVVRG